MPQQYNHSLSIYLHIPFCTAKCTYCAFNTYTKLEPLILLYVEALAQEICISGAVNPYPNVKTLYFGGGTPSLLHIDHFKILLSQLYESFNIQDTAEITTEANPNDLSVEYLTALRQAGINRLSIGMQSSNQHELKLFARRHDYQTVVDAVYMARTAGFTNLSLDLIYGIPQQTFETWQQSIDDLLALDPAHISLYALGLEQGTPLQDWVMTGALPVPDDDLAADMYEYATDRLAQAGYRQYEISNWARPGYECEHNLQYWRNLPYLGFGPGAHGYAAGVRYATMLSPQKYIQTLLHNTAPVQPFPYSPVVAQAEMIDDSAEVAETLITGLRLIQEGIDLAEFRVRFGFDLLDTHQKKISQFQELDLLEINQGVMRLTRKGRLLSNLIFRELV